jgi:hypothetical protein
VIRASLSLLAPLLPPNLVILQVNDMIPSSVTARTAVAADDYTVTLPSFRWCSNRLCVLGSVQLFSKWPPLPHAEHTLFVVEFDSRRFPLGRPFCLMASGRRIGSLFKTLDVEIAGAGCSYHTSVCKSKGGKFCETNADRSIPILFRGLLQLHDSKACQFRLSTGMGR